MKTIGKITDAGVTFRAVLLSLFLILINNYWITVIEVRWYALDGTCLPIFITPIFLLFLIALPNLMLRKYTPWLALRRGELLTIYIMIVMGATLASHDLIQNLFGTIGHPHYFATDSNQYKLFLKYLPSHLFISDKEALNGFYKGNVDPFVWPILRYWIAPLVGWGLLVLVIIGMMLCINTLIRKQWTENEKLVFPLVHLPIAMAAEDSGSKFYSNKLMWAGFTIAFLIGLINGLHVLYPSLPMLTGIKGYDLSQYFPNRPWCAVAYAGNGFVMASYPFAIGLAYFIPLDLCFSCWFFYILRKLWQVFCMAMGWDNAASASYYWDMQSSGAWLALGIVVFIGTIPYLRGVWRQAFKADIKTPEEAEDSRLYRLSFYGLALGMVFLLLFSRWMGLSPLWAILFFGLYFLLSFAITRVRAELGTPHEIVFVSPQQILLSLFGMQAIGTANMTLLQSMYWFNRGYRSNPMPNQLESMKMAEGTAIKKKQLLFAIMLAVFVGLITSYWANLQVTYSAGAQAKCLGFKQWVGAESFDRLAGYIKNKTTVDPARIAYMVVGAAIVTGLSFLRSSFVSLPFHPAGYALAISYAMDYFWFAFFVSWLVKLIIVRYGGMKLHNTCIPFFLGLMLGDFFIGSIWAIIGPLINTQAYRIFI